MKTIQLHLYKTHDMDLMQYDLKLLTKEISNLIIALSKNEPYAVNIVTKNTATEDIPEQLVLHFDLDTTAIEWLKQVPASKRNSFIKELLRNNFKNN